MYLRIIQLLNTYNYTVRVDRNENTKQYLTHAKRNKQNCQRSEQNENNTYRVQIERDGSNRNVRNIHCIHYVLIGMIGLYRQYYIPLPVLTRSFGERIKYHIIN